MSLFDYSRLCNQGNKNFGNPHLKHPSNGFLMWTNLLFAGDEYLDISLLIVQNYFWFCRISRIKLRMNIEINSKNFWLGNLMKWNPIPNSFIPNEHFTLLIQFISVQFIMNTFVNISRLTFLSNSWLGFKKFLNFFSFLKDFEVFLSKLFKEIPI